MRSNREIEISRRKVRSAPRRCSSHNLDLLTIGLVLDMWTEKANDGVKHKRVATQEDYDKF